MLINRFRLIGLACNKSPLFRAILHYDRVPGTYISKHYNVLMKTFGRIVWNHRNSYIIRNGYSLIMMHVCSDRQTRFSTCAITYESIHEITMVKWNLTNLTILLFSVISREKIGIVSSDFDKEKTNIFKFTLKVDSKSIATPFSNSRLRPRNYSNFISRKTTLISSRLVLLDPTSTYRSFRGSRSK